jgi:hypothetical protein
VSEERQRKEYLKHPEQHIHGVAFIPETCQNGDRRCMRAAPQLWRGMDVPCSPHCP